MREQRERAAKDEERAAAQRARMAVRLAQEEETRRWGPWVEAVHLIGDRDGLIPS